jgi:hypothetical protein
MSDLPIPTLVYSTLAIISAFIIAERVLAGDISAALWPGAIAAFCIYRLATQEDD